MVKEIICIDDLPTKKLKIGGIEIDAKYLGEGKYAMEDETYFKLQKVIAEGSAEKRKEVLKFLDEQLWGIPRLPIDLTGRNTEFTAVPNGLQPGTPEFNEWFKQKFKIDPITGKSI